MKSFNLFCILTDREMKTLSRKFTHEELKRFLETKLERALAIECEQIEQDEEFEINKGEIA